MKFDGIGMDPDLAANYAVHLIDKAKTPKERVAMLLNNVETPLTAAKNTPKILESKRSIDIYVGELLGIAAAGMFYNWAGEANGNTYQVMVGVEDAVKSGIENFLSDGAIWHDQTKEKMVFQQVTAQGYYPSAPVDSVAVANAITHKVKLRNQYPPNCGLIVNIYSSEGNVDFKKIAANCDLSSYTAVIINWYQLPEVDKLLTYYLDPVQLANNIPPPSLSVNLKRHPIAADWEYNFDDSVRGTSKR
jgi:hypothetical protein